MEQILHGLWDNYYKSNLNRNHVFKYTKVALTHLIYFLTFKILLFHINMAVNAISPPTNFTVFLKLVWLYFVWLAIKDMLTLSPLQQKSKLFIHYPWKWFGKKKLTKTTVEHTEFHINPELTLNTEGSDPARFQVLPIPSGINASQDVLGTTGLSPGALSLKTFF